MTHELLKIGNSEVTKAGIADLQRLYEAQTKAERALPALIDFQAAGKACEKHGWIDVAYLMSLPVQVRGKALKDAVDEAVEAFAGQKAYARSSDALPAWSFLTATQKAEGWVQYNFDGAEPSNVASVLFADGSSKSNKAGHWRWANAERIWSAAPDFTIIGYKANVGVTNTADDELNDLTPHEGEEEGECDCDASEAQPVEQEAEPERKFKVGDRVRDKLRSENGTVTGYTDSGNVEFLIDGREHTSIAAEDQLHSVDTLEEPIEAKPHVEDAISEIEAQVESEPQSTEPEAHQRFDRNGNLLKAGDRVTSSETNLSGILDEWEEWRENLPVRDGVVITLVNPAQLEKVETEAEPGTAETMQAIAQAVEAVEAEPETPSQPEELKAERKSYDFTGDYTEEEIRAKSGFDPRESQPDDIAATERAEFDAPQRQFYNPWAKTEKAEG